MSTADLYRPISTRQRHGSDRPHRQSLLTTRIDGISIAARYSMLACSVVALLVSSYLAWASFTSSPVAGCSGSSMFDCSHVLHSRWSKVLSVPVSVPAMATHLAVIGLLLYRPSSKRANKIRWAVLGFAAFAAAGAAVWFVGLQVFWLEHLCPYCLVAHVAGIVLAAVYFAIHPLSRKMVGSAGVAAAVSLAGLVSLQTLTEAPPTFEVIEHGAAKPQSSAPEQETLFEAPASSAVSVDSQAILPERILNIRPADAQSLLFALVNPSALFTAQVEAEPQEEERPTVSVLDNIKLRTKDWPLVGDPDADLVFVELFDYTCPYCQRTQQAIEGARAKFGDRLAIISLPLPLDGECNPTVRSTSPSHAEACELAKLAIAVWTIDADQFEPFHQYLFAAKPPYTEAFAKAATMVDETKLEETLQSEVPSDYISKNVALFRAAGEGGIPKLLFPQTTVTGAVESSETLINLIEKHLP